jgi:hypothetical protein
MFNDTFAANQHIPFDAAGNIEKLECICLAPNQPEEQCGFPAKSTAFKA